LAEGISSVKQPGQSRGHIKTIDNRYKTATRFVVELQTLWQCILGTRAAGRKNAYITASKESHKCNISKTVAQIYTQGGSLPVALVWFGMLLAFKTISEVEAVRVYVGN
jgi:hypothetical protein